MSSLGRIILLNGASSSGKSTLARRLQAALPTPFLLLSSDMLAENGCLPPQRDLISTDTDNVWSWQGRMRPKFFAGFHRTIAGFARAGNDVIVDHIVEYETWWDELVVMLEELDVWLLGVRCEVEEVERREKSRGDRKLGEGRCHLEVNRVHDIVRVIGEYDCEVNTTYGVDDMMVEDIIRQWNGRNPKSFPSSS